MESSNRGGKGEPATTRNGKSRAGTGSVAGTGRASLTGSPTFASPGEGTMAKTGRRGRSAGGRVPLVVLAYAVRPRAHVEPRAGLQPRLPRGAVGRVFPLGAPRSHARSGRGSGVAGTGPRGDQRGDAFRGGLVLFRFPGRLVDPAVGRRSHLVVFGKGVFLVEPPLGGFPVVHGAPAVPSGVGL